MYHKKKTNQHSWMSNQSKSGILIATTCLMLSSLTVPRLCQAEEIFKIGGGTSSEDAAQPESTTQKTPEQVVVIAPRFLRPNSDYHVLINLANSQVPATVDLQLIGARDSDREQTEAKSVLAHPNETQTVKFQVGDWPPAEYVLSVNVQAIDRSWEFKNEKPVTYQGKTFSAFIQTDKAIYKPGQLVQFRALFLTLTLTPMVLKDEINVTIQNPNSNIIREWQYQSNYRGLLSLEMPLSEDPILGDYTLKVSARNQEFRKQFTVAEYVLPTFEVDIQLPSYATYNESDIVVTTRASYTYGKPVTGHVTLTVQPLVRFSVIDTRPLEQAQYRARLRPDGSADFQIDVVKDLKQEGDIFEREVEFFALVEEDLTGRKYNMTKTLKIYPDKIKIERIDKDSGPLKPGLPKVIRYKVAYQDDIPVENNGPELELKYNILGRSIGEFSLRPTNGLIEHQLKIPARLNDPRVDSPVTAFRAVEVAATYRNKQHFLDPLDVQQTDSHQSMQIYLPQTQQSGRQARISVNDQLRVQVRSTEPMQQVTCQGLSKGDIVWALSKQVNNETELEFDIKVEPRMAPQFRILCFYIRADNKELIADSISVNVINGLVKNLVKLTTSRDEAKPGQEVEVGVFTKPNSLVGVLAVDQSVLLLKSGNDLNSKEILNDLKSYGTSGDGEKSKVNTADLLESADVIVITNGLVYDGFGYSLGRTYSNPVALQTVANAAAGRDGRPSRIALDSLILDHQIQPPEFHLNRPKNADSIRIRSLFPETWLWQNGTADSSGQIKFSSKIPDTITSWQISAFSMNEAHGFALSSGKTAVRVFRPFFIKLNLPYSIIRGEIINIQAVIFNYSKRPMPAKVILDNKRGEFEFVEPANSIEDEKYGNSSSESRLVQVPAEEGASVSFLVRPIKLGHIDIKVIAQGDYVGDGVVRKLLVKPEGQVQHFNRAMLVQLAGPQSTWRQNVSIAVPANAVPDSQKVFVSVIGDILGAGLSNIDDLLRLPAGCGEQNMIHLVPNIVILNYLKRTNRLRDNQRERAVHNIQKGYQQQLQYLRADGSFSAFGKSDANGSVWLTAYVLKTLKQAGEVITVDEKVLTGASAFLTRHSNSDGSIEEVGLLHHKELASKSLAESPTDKSKSIYLTAYTLIALMQQPDSGRSAASEQALERGLDFLERRLSEASQLSTYELSIIAHALDVAGGSRQKSADQAHEMLWSRAIVEPEDNQIHWSNKDKVAAEEGAREPEMVTISDERVDRAPREVQRLSLREVSGRQTSAPPLKEFAVKSDQSAHLFVPDSLEVEITSWALLTSVRRNELERALPIVRWLVSKQNSLGGFASTQDTVLAIEALASYAEANGRVANNSAQTIEVELVYPRANPSGLRRHNLDQVLVSRANALVQQQTRLSDDIGWVQIQATGVGSAVVQVSWQYNLLVAAERPAFYLNPTIDRSSNANYLQLSICTFYKGGDQADGRASSNMAVVEVELPSGYVADSGALPSLKRHPQIKRIDTAEGETRVLVYLDRVTREELCFTVPAHRSSKVANSKPVPVTIYDYYERDQAARIFYKPQLAGSCDICERDSCGESCAASSPPSLSRAKQSDKLISLHEQRNRQQLGRRRDETTPRRSDGTHGNLIGASASPTDQQPAFDVSKLLPLSSAFSALNQAAKNSSLHF